jgi:hypothetical protein
MAKPDATGPAELDTSKGGSSDPVNLARLHGWIAFGTKEGIWTVDPKRPNHELQLSEDTLVTAMTRLRGLA